MSALNDIAIAVVPRDGRLCLCTRINNELQPPVIHENDGDPAAAAAIVLEERVKHRHDSPAVYVLADAPAVIEAIRKHEKDVSPVALSDKPSAGKFHDRWSDLVFDFIDRTTNSGKLHLPDEDEDLIRELDAFTEIPGPHGKTRYTDPLTVELQMDRYPMCGVATVLATLPGNARASERASDGHDPLQETGHDPMAYRL